MLRSARCLSASDHHYRSEKTGNGTSCIGSEFVRRSQRLVMCVYTVSLRLVLPSIMWISVQRTLLVLVTLRWLYRSKYTVWVLVENSLTVDRCYYGFTLVAFNCKRHLVSVRLSVCPIYVVYSNPVTSGQQQLRGRRYIAARASVQTWFYVVWLWLSDYSEEFAPVDVSNEQPPVQASLATTGWLVN